MIKQKQLKIIHWLDTGIFPATIMFTLNYKFDEINKYLDKVKANDWKMGMSQDRKFFDGKNWCALRRDIENAKTGQEMTLFYIHIPRMFNFKDDMDYCKLAHEVLHITQFMMKDFLNPDNEFECVAYTHTHIMQQCLKILRGKK